MDTSEDWHSSVYKREEEGFNVTEEEWREIRTKIIKRDDYTCYRCAQKFKRQKDLTVHHILPRAEGGRENGANLVALCNPCHDIVEIEGYRSKAAIVGSYEGGVATPGVLVINDEDVDWQEDWRPPWHKHVYGGVKRRKS